MIDVIFADENDEIIGGGSRKEAIEKGYVRRIAQIYLFNSNGEMLLQKRAEGLSSNPGKWDGSAAGHVDVGEEYDTAAYRELEEELGVKGIPLERLTKHYSAFLEDSGRVEKRFNMLYRGTYDGEIAFDPGEVAEVKWLPFDEVAAWIRERPQDFSKGCVACFQVLQDIIGA